MALTTGSRLGVYQIVAPLGEGGMGAVYHARDAKLNRDVAIKVLLPEVAGDPERLARFQREAQILAALNHPNIAHIHGLEEGQVGQEGLVGPLLVMEFVEGPTLQEVIEKARPRVGLPVDDALHIALQIANALAAAHERGIVHRDLKPANVKVRDDGTVKVLDFGLAKAIEGAGGAGQAGRTTSNLDASPTLTSPALMTGVGVILGTAAYMAPEQAKGRAVDKRADVWAFGAVLFEMLTGARAFAGEDVSDTLASILRAEPDWTQLPSDVPPRVRQVLRACLQKSTQQRVSDMHDVRLALEGAFDTPAAAPAMAPAPARSFTRERVAWAALTTIALAGAVTAYLSRPVATRPSEMRLQIAAPAVGTGGGFALSPDGRMLAFRSNPPGSPPHLFLLRLDREDSQPLNGTEGAAAFFWSPDSRSLAFHVRNELKRIDVGDGRIQTVVETPQTAGGAWGPDGTILFTRSWVGPLFKVASSGGEATPATNIDTSKQSGHVSPFFLPDGRHYLFFSFGTPESMGIYLGATDSTSATRLVRNDSAAAFLPPDWVVFAREGSLVAQHLDINAAKLVGEPVTVAPHVLVDPVNGLPFMSTSASGNIAYQSRAAQMQLTWLDRTGRATGTVGAPDPDVLFKGATPSVTPDWRTMAVTRQPGGNADVWLTDLFRGSMRRITTDRANDNSPRLSPDGRQIVFSSDRNGGVLNLYATDTQGGTESLLLQTPQDKNPADWSPDGRYVLYQTQNVRTGKDLWALPLGGDKTPFPVSEASGTEGAGRFSPDGRWVAFSSSQSGRDEVYVQSFPDPSHRLQVSTEGGIIPQWSSDGRDVLFLSADDRLMRATLVPSGEGLEVGALEPLFAIPAGSYLVRTDGQRFLFFTTTQQASPITLLLNWSGAR